MTLRLMLIDLLDDLILDLGGVGMWFGLNIRVLVLPSVLVVDDLQALRWLLLQRLEALSGAPLPQTSEENVVDGTGG